MTRRFHYPSMYGDDPANSLNPARLPSLGLTPTPHTNLNTALGFTSNQVVAQSRYYSANQVAALNPLSVLGQDHMQLESVYNYAKANPGGLDRAYSMAMGLAAVGALSFVALLL